MPETYIEYEIGEEAPERKTKELVAKNTLWALKKEKLVPRTASLIIPEGAYTEKVEDWEVEADRWTGTWDFEVYQKPVGKMIAIGQVQTLGEYWQDENKVLLMDLTITHFEKVEPEHPGVMYPRGY